MMRGTPSLPALVVMLACVIAVPPSFAQEEPIYIDLGVVGLSTLQQLNPTAVFRPLDMAGSRSSARAWAMGGAYVAQGSGMDGISWNPAGLGWLERVDVTADLRWTTSSGSTSGFPDTFNVPNISPLLVTKYEVNLKSKLAYNQMGAGGSIRPFGVQGLAAGLSFRRYMDVTFPEEVVSSLVSVGSTFPISFAIDGKESGGVDAAALTVAYQVLPDMLSLGANLNYLDGHLSIDEQMLIGVGGSNFVGGTSLKSTYKGFSADLGAQFRREGSFAVGLRYTPGFTLEVRGGTFRSQSVAADATQRVFVDAKVSGYDMDVPALLSFGGWVQPLPWLSVAAELDRQNWSETGVEYTTEFPNREADPSLPLRDVTNIHLGAEGRLFRIGRMDLPVQIGFRTGPLSMAELEVKGRVDELDWEGGDTDSKTLSLGIGLQTENLRYDLAWGLTDYTLKRFYYNSPSDPFVNPQSIAVDIDRRVNQLRLSATLAL